jgi:hypothetical protein
MGSSNGTERRIADGVNAQGGGREPVIPDRAAIFRTPRRRATIHARMVFLADWLSIAMAASIVWSRIEAGTFW